MKNILLLIFITLTSVVSAQTWVNPLTVPNEVGGVGVADPYVMRHNGIYYLYATNDGSTSMRCWYSKDLVNWSNSIVCTTDPIVRHAYAPEVIYWNGVFYMYTSPAGNGHYVLSSDSPTGPFVSITGNIGKEIDGSVFIDDDAKMYFLHASGAGVQGCTMSSLTSIGSSVNLNAHMSGQWTEGPGIIKRNGIYHLLYTGNHFKSAGYRVDYAKNTTTNPISRYTPQTAQNPILINTEGSFIGLGHGAPFLGPDLDTYYFTYHNLVPRQSGPVYRRFNFDRIAWNGDKLLFLGPTTWGQQIPQQVPSDYFEREEIDLDWSIPNGGNWEIREKGVLYQDIMDDSDIDYKAIFTAARASDYTAEFTVREVAKIDDQARIGAVFSYNDEQNYGVVLFNTKDSQLEINFLINGVWETAQTFSLPQEFDYSVWHSIRIEKKGASYKFFVDRMQKAALTSDLQGGYIGYITRGCQGDFSYIALSDNVNGSGIFDTYKPVPGNIAAVHYNRGGEGVGYQNVSSGSIGNQNFRNDDVDMAENPDGGYHINNETGEWYKYNVNVQQTGIYNVGIRYKSSLPNQIKIWEETTDVTSDVIELPATGDAWTTFTVKDLVLTAGYQTLKIETISGDFEFYEMQFRIANNELITIEDSFEGEFSTEWNYSAGDWTIESGMAKLDGFGKRTIGDTGWTDYTIETDVRYIRGMNGGLIFRVNNPAQGGENNDPVLGTDFLQGYFVGITQNSVVLGKHNYGWEVLASASGSYRTNTTYSIKVVVSGAKIQVFVTDMDVPKINYTDPNPFIQGKVGYRVHDAYVLFDNFRVTTTINNDIETNIDFVSEGNQINIFPNPASDVLIVSSPERLEAKIYDITGQLLIIQSMQEGRNHINVKHLPQGMYMVKLDGNKVKLSQKILITNNNKFN